MVGWLVCGMREPFHVQTGSRAISPRERGRTLSLNLEAFPMKNSFGDSQIYPIATAVVVDSMHYDAVPSAPSAPPVLVQRQHAPPASAPLSVAQAHHNHPTQQRLPTVQNEEGAKQFLTARQWPEALQAGFIKNCSNTPLRYFICDDSGSMETEDGRYVVEVGGKNK